MLEKLSSLSRLDLEILDTSKKLTQCKQRVEELFAGERGLEEDVKNLRDKKAQLDLQVRNIERSMAELEEEQSALDRKRTQATSQRVLEAVDSSLGKVRDALSKTESEWISLSESQEAMGEALKKKQDDLEGYRGRESREVDEANSELSQFQPRLLEMEGERSQFLDGLEGNVIEVYERFRKKSRFSRVVFSLESEHCPSCSMQLARRLYEDVRYQGQVHFCKDCGVILFWDS